METMVCWSANGLMLECCDLEGMVANIYGDGLEERPRSTIYIKLAFT